MDESDSCGGVNGAALKLLVENHRRFLAFLKVRTQMLQDAEEILQTAYVKAIAKESSLEDETVVAWFYRLLRNALIDYYRRHEAAAKASQHFRDAPMAAEEDQELEGAVCQCFRELLPTLKPEYGEILNVVDLGGESVSAAAVELGITANNAGVRLHRARAALKARLEEMCRTCAVHGCLDCTCQSC
jgi:RNA polymerase sigma-70 factor (ECF subfamily)